jgi:hypothetical protein
MVNKMLRRIELTNGIKQVKHEKRAEPDCQSPKEQEKAGQRTCERRQQRPSVASVG